MSRDLENFVDATLAGAIESDGEVLCLCSLLSGHLTPSAADDPKCSQ
jgi:hypothetical protein